MFQLFKGKRNEKRSLKLPPGLSKKDQRRVQEVIDRARKNDGIPRTAQQSIPFDRMFPDGIRKEKRRDPQDRPAVDSL